jgi:hypothetical protein
MRKARGVTIIWENCGEWGIELGMVGALFGDVGRKKKKERRGVAGRRERGAEGVWAKV